MRDIPPSCMRAPIEIGQRTIAGHTPVRVPISPKQAPLARIVPQQPGDKLAGVHRARRRLALLAGRTGLAEPQVGLEDVPRT